MARGIHAIALDEQRLLFTPTLWLKASNVKQLVFPGAHSDVGGDYKEAGLSDIALKWTIDEMMTEGVQFADNLGNIKPDPLGPAHKPWAGLVKVTGGLGVRIFKPDSGIVAHASFAIRKLADAIVHNVGDAAAKYSPKNWLN